MTGVPLRDLDRLLRELRPVLHEPPFAYCALPAGVAPPEGTIGWFREAEGVTAILPQAEAERAGLDVAFSCAMLTLEVPSALDAVGLTAAVATALTADGIPCNVVAAVHHDHLFVPWDRRLEARAALERLSARARG